MDWVCPLRKILTWLRGTNFCINCTSSPILHRVSWSYEIIPNAPKHYETHRNMSLGSNRVDWDCPLKKIPTSHRGTNFCINCTSSPRFASNFMQLRNNPKCTKILQRSNGGLGAFVTKNPDVTSWHELLH